MSWTAKIKDRTTDCALLTVFQGDQKHLESWMPNECAEEIERRFTEIATHIDLMKQCRDVIDDSLEERPARHSLGRLHARLRTALKQAGAD